MSFINLSLYDTPRIMESGATRGQKIVLLWLITQIDYRGMQGKPAEAALLEVVGDQEVLNAYSQIVGIAMGESSVGMFVRLFDEISEGVL